MWDVTVFRFCNVDFDNKLKILINESIKINILCVFQENWLIVL
jgi:hypothetical protein